MERNCKNCLFFRDKGWDEIGGCNGICENPFVIKQVSILNEEDLKKFVSGETEKDVKSNARFIKNSLRFDGEFGCLHFNYKV